MPQLAILIIGKCGFGFSFNWLEPPRSTDGKMTIQRALRAIADSVAAVIFVPRWFKRLSFSGYLNLYLATWSEYIIFFKFHRMSELVEADEHLMEFMKTQVRERKAVIGSTAPSERKAGAIQADVFTMLVKANEDEGGKLKLDDEELVRTELSFNHLFLETLLSLRLQIGNIFIMLFAGHGKTNYRSLIPSGTPF